jgi:hypothetical protein
VVCNFTPVIRSNYRVGAPHRGHWTEVLNSDGAEYGGSGVGNYGGVETTPIPSHGRNHSLNLTLPPLGMVVFRPDTEAAPAVTEHAVTEHAADSTGDAAAEPAEPADAVEGAEDGDARRDAADGGPAAA